MNLGELIAACRSRAADEAEPPLWQWQEWVRWLNEAQREACLRARLIEDDESEATEVVTMPGVLRYPLHPSVIDVLHVAEGKTGRAVIGWDLNETHLILPASRSAGMLRLRVVRLPLDDMTGSTDEPEINTRHHERLLDWALRCAYLKQDSDTYDESRSLKYEASFEVSFGVRPDSNVQRKHRRQSVRRVRMFPF